MSVDGLKEFFNKVPFGFVMVLVIAFYGYQYYEFENGSDSPLVQKLGQIESLKTENAALQTKVKAGEEFQRSLEVRRNQLREMARRLDEMKATLSESLDVADFMKTVITEAKKVGLAVVRMEPGNPSPKEFYIQQPFTMSFRGVYVQLVVFLERMANVQKIVRVEKFKMRSIGSSLARYVELEGEVELRAYRYLASNADALARAAEAPAASDPNAPPSPGGAQ